MGQPECNTSKLKGTVGDESELVEYCWEYAWVIRAILVFIFSSCLILTVFGLVSISMIVKYIMEDAGFYSDVIDFVNETNEANKSHLTFP